MTQHLSGFPAPVESLLQQLGHTSDWRIGYRLQCLNIMFPTQITIWGIHNFITLRGDPKSSIIIRTSFFLRRKGFWGIPLFSYQTQIDAALGSRSHLRPFGQFWSPAEAGQKLSSSLPAPEQLQRPVEDGKQLLSLKDGWVLQRRWQWTWNFRATVAVHLASGAALGQFLDDTQIGVDPRGILCEHCEPFCSAPVFWQGWEACELELLDPLSFMVREYHWWKVLKSSKLSCKVKPESIGGRGRCFRIFQHFGCWTSTIVFVALEPKVGNLIAHGKAGGERMYIDSRGTAQNEWTNNSEETFECGGKWQPSFFRWLFLFLGEVSIAQTKRCIHHFACGAAESSQRAHKSRPTDNLW